jgi:hypothetical protein
VPSQHKHNPVPFRPEAPEGVAASTEATRRWRAANRERSRELNRQSDARNPESYLLARARHRAKTDGLPFDLHLADIVIPETCPILGVPLARQAGSCAGPNSPSLDRIIPALGYVKGNVQVISHKANSLKRDGTLAELVKLGEWAATELARQGGGDA